MENENAVLSDDVTTDAPAAPTEDTSTAPILSADDGLDDLDSDTSFDDLESTEEPATPDSDEDEPVAPEVPATPETPETPETPARGREARLEQLANEISELRSQAGITPNADIRAAVKERNLLREIASNDIRGQQLQLERDLLEMENPQTGEAYSPTEAASIARAAAVEAEATQLKGQSRDLQIERNQSMIEREIDTTMRHYPMFQETINGQPNPAFDKQATQLAGEHLLDAYITEPVLDEKGEQAIDRNGQPMNRVVDIKRSPTEILKSVATSVESYRKNAEGKAAQNLTRQTVNADVPVSGSNSASRTDPDFKAFDDVMDEDY